MGPVRKTDKKYVRFSWEQLELQCEWRECELTTDDLNLFLQHVDNHLHSETDTTECCWRECSGYSGLKFTLTMHVLFHAFHTKIKCFGKNLLRRKNIGTCTLDPRARNIIPDAYEMVCRWDDCGVLFLSPETFYRHVDVHAEDNPKGNNLGVSIACLWLGCTSKFSSLYRLKEHMRSHTQERVMACPTCGSMFASRTKFFDHVKRQALAVAAPATTTSSSSSEETIFQCAYCSRKLASERLLRDHMRQHVNHYKCPYCDMTCPTPSGVRRHVLYKHNQSKMFKCSQCDYGAKSVGDLRRHVEGHGEELAHACDIEDCTFRSKTSSQLGRHVKSVHNNGDESMFVCHICEKLFARGNYLTKHLLGFHRLRWPSGHSRFRYHRDEGGVFKLQTVRYESIELCDALLEEDEESEEDCDGQLDPNSRQADQVGTFPVIVFEPAENGTGGNQTAKETEQQQPVSVVELVQSAGDSNTYFTPDGSSVVYVNLQNTLESGSSLRTIQFVTQGNDGTPTVQTAEVIADGGRGPVQL